MPRAGSPERAPTRAASAAADDRGWSSSWWVGKGRSGCSRSTYCFYTLRTGDGRALRSRLKTLAAGRGVTDFRIRQTISSSVVVTSLLPFLRHRYRRERQSEKRSGGKE